MMALKRRRFMPRHNDGVSTQNYDLRAAFCKVYQAITRTTTTAMKKTSTAALELCRPSVTVLVCVPVLLRKFKKLGKT